MQGQLPAPTASGSLGKTPFPHLLIYALERRLSGTFELVLNGAPVATVLMAGGCPAKVRTQEPIHFLGQLMVELGLITAEQLQASHARMQESPRLQGQILLELGATDLPRLDAGLRAQVERKVEHLFGLPSDTTFAYYDELDLLLRFGGPPTPIDPFPVLWRGVREAPAWEHVDATLRRVGSTSLKVAPSAQLERFAFSRNEAQLVEVLRARPLRVVDVTSALGPSVGQVLVYFLMIMKQVELVEAPAPSSPRLPQSAPTGQAFARVQLQRQTARHAPVIVEEVIATSPANDERASSPGMPSPVLPASAARRAFGGGVPAAAAPQDIAALITDSVQPEPAPGEPSDPNLPAPPSVPSFEASPGEEADRPAASALTGEQVALKEKILERAEQITSQDYFAMLGLDREADIPSVQKAFIALARVWHPDRLPPALLDVQDACSKVFTHLTEAHATLTDPERRQEYKMLLKDGGATPDDQAKIQAILEAATDFQKVEILLKRNPNDAQAHEMVRRCVALDPEQHDYIATLAWLDAQKPECQGRDKTLEKIALLDRCVVKNANSERAFFYRGLLYKRINETSKALKDFKKASELNPRNLDAMREVRLHKMRGGVSNPPPPNVPPGDGPKPTKPAKPAGSLLGKLFKK